MALPDPQTIEYDAVVYTLPRISSSANSAQYYAAMGTTGADLRLSINNSYGKRTRRVSRLDVGLVNSNPFATGISSYESTSVYLVVDTPAQNGLVLPETAKKSVDAYSTWLINNSITLKLLQGHS